MGRLCAQKGGFPVRGPTSLMAVKHRPADHGQGQRCVRYVTLPAWPSALRRTAARHRRHLIGAGRPEAEVALGHMGRRKGNEVTLFLLWPCKPHGKDKERQSQQCRIELQYQRSHHRQFRSEGLEHVLESRNGLKRHESRDCREEQADECRRAAAQHIVGGAAPASAAAWSRPAGVPAKPRRGGCRRASLGLHPLADLGEARVGEAGLLQPVQVIEHHFLPSQLAADLLTDVGPVLELALGLAPEE